MYSDAKKIHLIEKVLKTDNEIILQKIEEIFKKTEVDKNVLSAFDLSGS